MNKKPSIYLILGAFAAIYFIWGSTYLFVRILVMEMPPFLMAGIRFLIAALIIFTFILIKGGSIKISKQEWKSTFIAGTAFLTIGNGLMTLSLKYIDSYLAALLVAAQPLILLVMMRIWDKKPMKSTSIIGVLLGFLGMYLLVSQDELLDSQSKIWAMCLVGICLLSWGFGSMYVGRAKLPENFFLSTGYQMIIAAFSLLTISVILGEKTSTVVGLSSNGWMSMIYLSFFGSVIAFTSFNFLLKYISPEKVATSTYVNPIVAAILGFLVLEESITLQTNIAAAILLTGVYFINVSKRKRKNIA